VPISSMSMYNHVWIWHAAIVAHEFACWLDPAAAPAGALCVEASGQQLPGSTLASRLML
jgi:hypothetical protein